MEFYQGQIAGAEQAFCGQVAAHTTDLTPVSVSPLLKCVRTVSGFLEVNRTYAAAASSSSSSFSPEGRRRMVPVKALVIVHCRWG